MTLRHTLDTDSAVNFTGGDLRITFEAGSRETDEYDEETERRAVELYDDVEYADADAEAELEELNRTESGPERDATSAERTVEDEAAEAVEEIEAREDAEPDAGG